MVYCTKCGYRNPNDSKHCGQCGVTLEFIQRARGKILRKESEAECFGMQWSGTEWGLLSGIIIILLGILWLLERYLPLSWGNIWGLLVIAFGVIILTRFLVRSRS
jgi:uncharacterized membrane protein YvbJ